MGTRGEVFSDKFTTQYGRKTYFFNIKENRFHDLYFLIAESIKQDREHPTFQRNQIVVFEVDWQGFLGFLHKIQKNLNERNFSWRCLFTSKENKRAYYVSFSKTERVLRINLSEKKASEEVHSLLIDSYDFPRFVEKFNTTLPKNIKV